MPVQRCFIEDNQMVQALAANRANDPLDVRSLLRYAWRAEHFTNTELFHWVREIGTEDPIAVPQQMPRHAVPRKRLPKLLRRPFRRGVSRDAEVKDPAALVRQHQKNI
jgi:hypothetical protein